MQFFKKTVFGLATLAAVGFAYNPISTYHYLADPAAAADDDYFYIITDSDDPAPYNAEGYSIKALYGFRSKDMQNWTDFGIIYDARKVDGIGDIWASGIAVHDGKFYIVFPDGGGSGIGLIKADGIAGPWSNPIENNKKLINNWGNGLADCDGIGWCFDPAIFFDDDGKGYFTFGGGQNVNDEANKRDYGDNLDLYELNATVDGLKPETKTRLKVVQSNGKPVKNVLEASYIHKYNDVYYLSYSTNSLDIDGVKVGEWGGPVTIDYATSKDIKGPYVRQGVFMDNPTIDKENINSHNNNHHGIAEFKGRWYVVYHDRRIANGYDGLEKIPAEDGQANPNSAFHRSVSIDEFTYNADGTMNKLTFTKEGPKQIADFDPYDWYPALTSSKQKGIRSRSLWTPGNVAESILLPLSTKESWIRVSGVDFGTSATNFVVEASSVADGNTIEIHTKTATGALAGTCSIKKTGNKNTYEKNTCEVSGLSGKVDYLFLVFKGSQDSTMAVKAWGFEGSGSTPRTPYGGTAATVPGIIQVENFDVPGSGSANQTYYDTGMDNNEACIQSDASKKEKECSTYREGTGVDIKKTEKGGNVIGWFANGEWLEYTVNVTKGGTYTLYVAGASDKGGSVQFYLADNGKLVQLTDKIAIQGSSTKDDENAEQNFEEYAKRGGVDVELTEGEHIIRMVCTEQWVDIDYFNLVYGSQSPDDALITDGSEMVASSSSATASESGESSASDASSSASAADGTGSSPSTGDLTAISMGHRLNLVAGSYKVFDAQGKFLGKVRLNDSDAKQALKMANYKAGVYILRGKGVNMMVNTVK